MEQMTADEIKQLMLETKERQQEFERNAPIIALRKELARLARVEREKRKVKGDIKCLQC